MNELLTWKSMTTYAGSVLATGVVTQFLKDFGILKRVPTRLFSYVIALVLLALADEFTCGLTLERAALIPVNAMMVSLAANGAYDAVIRKKGPPDLGGNKKHGVRDSHNDTSAQAQRSAKKEQEGE